MSDTVSKRTWFEKLVDGYCRKVLATSSPSAVNVPIDITNRDRNDRGPDRGTATSTRSLSARPL